ncbi:MAG TPA: hypothetical protein VNA11_07865 [Pseudonocardia sp.]|nr:hypothetical protein [Pseudonocardia sp.]
MVEGGSADITVGYGHLEEPVDVRLPSGYRPRPASVPAPAPTWVDGLPCFHAADAGGPDVLGEVFEWLAAPHELACIHLDSVGRVPPEHTLAGSHGIDRRIPWVNRWLARLHVAVRAAFPRLPARPPSPFGAGPVFVASHDLDHLSGHRLTNARRILKNVGISLLQDRDLRTAAQIVGSAAGHLTRREPALVGVNTLLAGEAARGVRATYTVIAESTHRRDPGYRLDDDFVARTLAAIAAAGHEIAVHGSYRSLVEPGQLAREYDLLRAAGHAPTGGRQHWLRHRGGELFSALVDAAAEWDSTCGHPDDIGYRHGAAFPFLPYDFDREAAHPIVEIPLIVMERALLRATADPSQRARAAVDVLRAAGADGWGGVAVLWHDDAFTATTFPAHLAQAYWDVLDAGDRWVTAGEVAAAARDRWAAAGVGTAWVDGCVR